MTVRRSEVLTHGQDIDALGSEVAHRDEQLVPFLAEAAHQARLGRQCRVHLSSTTKEAERAIVSATWASDAVEPRDRLQVVVQNVGAGIHHDLQSGIGALEVGRE